VAQRNDQVFQLSLTEIAFTIAFLLLLLLGYLVYKEQSERQAAEAELAKVQAAESATAALAAAKSELSTTLQGAGVANPDEVISKLIDAEQMRAERDQLRQRVDDLDAQLTALTELKAQLEQAAAAGRPDVTQDTVLSALILRDQIRAAVEQSVQDAPKKADTSLQPQPPQQSTPLAATEPDSSKPSDSKSAPPPAPSTKVPRSASRAMPDRQVMEAVRRALATTAELRRQLKEKLDRDLQSGREGQTVQEIVTAARSFGELAKGGRNPEVITKENADLRGQVAFLKNRLDARGGRDYPPCWADESGKVEFLFSVEVRPDAVVVASAWPAHREAAARALPGIDDVLAGPHSNQAFVSKIQGIFNWSRTRDPECRHYVRLRSSISDAVQSDRARLMVENYFYKVEVRR
jgi:hypothetical protein